MKNVVYFMKNIVNFVNYFRQFCFYFSDDISHRILFHCESIFETSILFSILHSILLYILYIFSLWGNSYDHSSYDHTRWRTSATVSSTGSIVSLVRNTVLSYLYTIQGRHRSWFCVTCFDSLCICLFFKYGLVKLEWYDRNLQTRHRRHDRNCPRGMIVTVQIWS